MYLINYVLITCLTIVCVHLSNQSVPITCLTPVCVLVSISLSACYLCNSCVWACFQFTTYYMYLYVYLIQSVHNIFAAPVCVCDSVHVYTCISNIKSVHILYLCVYMHIITIQSEYSVFAAPVSVCMCTHVQLFTSLNKYTCTHHDMYIYH